MYGVVAPMLSVIVTDDELKLLVSSIIQHFLVFELEQGCGCVRPWQQIVEEEQDDAVVVLVERLRIAYNIEV